MPRGFIGMPATTYLRQAADAHSNATSTGKRAVSNAPSTTNLRERQLPFAPSEGNSGGSVSTGRGNSSNIVVSQSEYEAITRGVSQADERVGACLYNSFNEIEMLCQTAFILPDTIPRCLNICDSVKKSLGEYSALTHDLTIGTRRFAQEISDIGY